MAYGRIGGLYHRRYSFEALIKGVPGVTSWGDVEVCLRPGIILTKKAYTSDYEPMELWIDDIRSYFNSLITGFPTTDIDLIIATNNVMKGITPTTDGTFNTPTNTTDESVGTKGDAYKYPTAICDTIWAKWDMGSTQTGVLVIDWAEYGVSTIEAWLETSTDGVNWTQVDYWSSVYSTRIKRCYTNKTARYVRLRAHQIGSEMNELWLRIWELYFFAEELLEKSFGANEAFCEEIVPGTYHLEKTIALGVKGASAGTLWYNYEVSKKMR